MLTQEVKQLLQFSAISAAQKTGIPEDLWDSTANLHAAIKVANPQLYSAFEKFNKAYLAWFLYNEKIEDEGKSRKLNDAEKAHLVELIQTRARSREAFLKKLRESEKK